MPIPANQPTFVDMRTITAPYVALDDPDRPIRCQDALNAAVQELVGQATAVGWSDRETLAAIIEIADNSLLSLAANDDAEVLIALLKRMT